MSEPARVSLDETRWRMPEFKSPVLEGLQEQEVKFRDNNPDHYEIPALRRPGCVLMRLEFTKDEREQIYDGDDLFVEVMTDGGIQPMRFTVGSKEYAEDWQAEGYGDHTLPEVLEVGNRHVGLEAAARLMRGTYVDWELAVKNYNALCVKPPLPDEEVEQIIEGVREWKR